MKRKGYLETLRRNKIRKEKLLRRAKIAGGLAYVSLLLYALFYSGAFAISAVYISVVPDHADLHERISSRVEEVIHTRIGFAVPRKNNVFLVSDSALRDAIRGESLLIRDIAVDKKLIAGPEVSITVTLRSAYGTWCDKENNCYRFDENGLLYQLHDHSGEFIVEDLRPNRLSVGKTVSPELMDSMDSARRISDSLHSFQYKSFIIPDYSVGEFWIETTEGWMLYLDASVDVRTQLLGIKKLFEEKLGFSQREQLEYIDARIDKRLYYKLREQ